MRKPISSQARPTSAATLRLSSGEPERNGAMSMMGTERMVIWFSVLGQAEYALAEDIAENLRGAGADTAAPGEENVEFPLAVVGREGARGGDLRVQADD